MILVPADSVGDSKPKQDVTSMLKLILKLAKVNAYNEFGNILNTYGGYNSDSNIEKLLEYCFSTQEEIKAENDFIELLFKAKVEPELIINKNMRAKLQELYNKPSYEFLNTPIIRKQEIVIPPTPKKSVKQKHSNKRSPIKLRDRKIKKPIKKSKQLKRLTKRSPIKSNKGFRRIDAKVIKSIPKLNWEMLSDDE